jgi:hypothetical protein
MSDDDLTHYADARSHYNNPYQFQPVTIVNGVASIALAIIVTILMVALLRSQARHRRLLEQLMRPDGAVPPAA